MTYKDKQSFTMNGFKLDLYPFVAAPDNRFEPASALQYGADFQLQFHRSGAQKSNVGILQLIFPQTAIFSGTTPRAWNVDKQRLSEDVIPLARCLYGTDGRSIGNQSTVFAGQAMRSLSPNGCSMIDTPREIMGKFSMGIFNGVTTTKFANYVVELSSKTGILFNQGIVWGYSFVQDPKTPDRFNVVTQEPREVRLRDTSEHLGSIATALKLTKEMIRSWVS
jgi:hypothetical protein